MTTGIPTRRSKTIRGFIFDTSDQRLKGGQTTAIFAVNTSQDVRAYTSPATRVITVHITHAKYTQDAPDDRIVSFRGVVLCEGVTLQKGPYTLALPRGTLVQGELIVLAHSNQVMGWLTDRDTVRARLRAEQHQPLQRSTA